MVKYPESEYDQGLHRKLRTVIKNQINRIAKARKAKTVKSVDDVERLETVKDKMQEKRGETPENKMKEIMEEHAGEDVEEPDSFAKVRETIKPESLRILALDIRRQWEVASSQRHLSSNMDCQIKSENLTGSYHILYQIEFSDNVRWLLKVPSNGHKDCLDKLSASSLRAEALTMRLIKRRTTIPIPDVYGFDDTCDNKISCAFIMMEHITGYPLQDVWFNPNEAPEVVEQHRSRALHDIAKAMIQLNKFTFFRGGRIIFDEDENPSRNTGSFTMMDMAAMFDQVNSEEASGDGNIYSEIQPVSDARGYLTCMLHKRVTPEDQYSVGYEELIQMFIDWAVQENQSLLKKYMAGNKDQNRFVLSHPDFDIQNFIVSEDGSLRGVIDWDGVIATPRGIAGNENYPGWLTRDWDAMAYNYDPENTNKFENSPSELRFYRDMYQKIIGRITGSNLAAVIAARSLVYDNLSIALFNPIATALIIDRIFDEINAKLSKELKKIQPEDELTRAEESAEVDEDPEKDEGMDEGDKQFDDILEFNAICMDLGEGLISEAKQNLLERGFRALFHEE